MSIRTARVLLTILLFSVVPLPMVFLGEGWVPGVRHLLFTGVIAAVAAVGGGGGPVPVIGIVFALHALVAALLAFLAASALTGVLRRLPPRAVAAVTVGVIVIAVGVALAIDIYETPFGRAPRGNLTDVLS